MDPVDAAQAHEEAVRADSLAAQRRAARLDAPGNPICADCGEDIPIERRRALPSAIRCVQCQAWVERLGRS